MLPKVIFVFSSLLASTVSATCYWQNSTLAPNSPWSIATDDTACFPNQENSPCCGTGWSCLSDGVCYIKQGQNEFWYRGTCTDKTWDSQQCPGWCFAENSNTSIPLINCKKSTGEDWYCCPGDDNCDCETGKDAVKLGATQPVTVTVIGSTTWPGFQSTNTPISAGNIAGSGTSTSLVTSTISSKSSSSSASGTATSADVAASSTSPAVSSATNSSSKSNTALAAGLGAGIGVAVILIAGAAFMFYHRRSKARHASNQYAHPPRDSDSAYSGAQRLPMTPPVAGAGVGYYATQVISEKDGRNAHRTQELPGYNDGVGGRSELMS